MEAARDERDVGLLGSTGRDDGELRHRIVAGDGTRLKTEPCNAEVRGGQAERTSNGMTKLTDIKRTQSKGFATLAIY